MIRERSRCVASWNRLLVSRVFVVRLSAKGLDLHDKRNVADSNSCGGPID
jgi:hypothetical protein